MLEPHHDFDPGTDEGALVAAIRHAPHDDTPKLGMADWQDDYGSPVVAAMYRHAVEAGRLNSKSVEPLAVPDYVTKTDGYAVSRHAAVLSGLTFSNPTPFTISRLSPSRAVRHAGDAVFGMPEPHPTLSHNAAAAQEHMNAAYRIHYRNRGPGHIAAMTAHTDATAVHRRLAEQK